jgi:hypothetical protein
VFDRCPQEVPPLYVVAAERTSACFLRDNGVVASTDPKEPT